MARKMLILWPAGALGLLVAFAPVGIQSFEWQRDVDTEAMLDVSVSIKTITHVRIDKFGDSVWESNSGSGFVVDAQNCEVWTNHHVVENAALVEVYPRGWTNTSGIPAEVVNSTPRTDVAVLRMHSCDRLHEARLGDSGQVRAGDETYAVGNPLGRNPHSISRGIISHTLRYISGTTPYLQTDAAINPGNSGGALFNRNGEVVGMNTALASPGSGSNVGIGYAVPINVVKEVAAQLHAGPPSWGDAGIGDHISNLTPDEAAVFKVPEGLGAIVLTSEPTEGPSSGKLRTRDVIYRIADRDVEDQAQALRVISAHDPGNRVRFDLIRQGESTSVEITLADGWKEEETQEAEPYEGHLGMSLEMWNDREGEEGKFTKPVITMVQSLGPAHRAHISSSQHAMALRGPFAVSYQLDVKTITGVVYDGQYHAVSDIDTVEQLAETAANAGAPMLLEIEYWARKDPMDVQQALQHLDTAFFKLLPSPSEPFATADEESNDLLLEAAVDFDASNPFPFLEASTDIEDMDAAVDVEEISGSEATGELHRIRAF